MSSSSGTFALSNIASLSLSLSSENNPDQTQEISRIREQSVDQPADPSLFSVDNPNHTQEISRIGEQSVDQEMAGLNISKSRPNGTFTPADPSLFSVDNPNHTQEISHVGEQNVDQEMVGLDISKSSRNKRKRLRSDVWTMFEKCEEGNGNVKAICSLCKKSFDGSSNKGTTHLRNHFKSCQNKINEGGASGSGDKRAGNSVTDQQLNPLDRVKMLIKQYRSGSPKPAGDTDIINVYKEEKEKLRIYFEKLSCCFSLTITNTVGGTYTGFMVHFIDDDWKLKEKFIGLKCIEGDQDMKVLKNVLSDFGINKISSMVTECDSDIYVLNSDERENGFSYQGSLLSNCKFCVGDFYDIDMTCPDFEDEIEEILRDHLMKIFNYISETSSNIGTFQIAARSLGKEATAKEIPTEDMLDFWSVLYLVKIALDLKEAFFELENMDPDFKSINLTKEQWDVITTFYQFCEEDDCGEINWNVLDHGETANIYFPVLCRMYKKSLVLVTLNSFISGKIHLEFVREAEKCWDQSNLILAVAAVLDPRFKMDIVKHWYKRIYGDECETRFAIFTDYFTNVYNEYAKGTNNFRSYSTLDILGNSCHDNHSGQSLYNELHLYLEKVSFPLFEGFDVLDWWRVYSKYFPTLAKMARDFLSIKILTPYGFMSLVYSFPLEDFDSDIVKEAFTCTRNWLNNY